MSDLVKFVHEPVTVEEFVSNARFQLDNVDGYVQMARDRNSLDLNAARIKAECLVDAAAALLAKLEAECRRPEAERQLRPTSEVAA